MAPTSHEEFEIRDIDRANLEQKEGMSIEEMIKKGIHVSEGLLKEHEFDLQSERKKSPPEEKPEYDGTLVEVDGEYMPEFDEDGLEIDYN